MSDKAALELRCVEAFILQRERCLLAIEGEGPPPPAEGTLCRAGGNPAWASLTWPKADGAGWSGLALSAALPASDDKVLAISNEVANAPQWDIAAPLSLDVDPVRLAQIVQAAMGDARAVFRFLLAGLPDEDAPSAAATAEFAKRFLRATAQHDGFVEILGAPDGSGLFLQGWSMSLSAGEHRLSGFADGEVVYNAAVATFERSDILPPGKGFCGFSLDAPTDLGAIDAVYVDAGDKLLRLDVTTPNPQRLNGAEAVAHIQATLPRLEAPRACLRSLRRVCRPRFAGENTLASLHQPVAAAVDRAVVSPRGDIFVRGWLLDPMRRVERLLLKNSASLCARLDANWVRLPRPDLAAAFGEDPRFKGLLADGDQMHGFLVTVPTSSNGLGAADGSPKAILDALKEVYLELVLDDDACAFLPIHVDACADRARFGLLVDDLGNGEPEESAIVIDHLAPFVEGLGRPKSPRPALGSRELGCRQGTVDVSALVPVTRPGDLDPLFSLLAGSPEAARLELVLCVQRSVAAALAVSIDGAFAFYGLQGSMVTVGEPADDIARLEAAAAVAKADKLLLWKPSVLPRAGGWLEPLLDGYAESAEPALLSPTLIFEDGSIAFGGTDAGGSGAEHLPRLLGFSEAWLPTGGIRRVQACAAEFALLSKASVELIGGFRGRLVSDVYQHLDLAWRIEAAGGGCYWDPSISLWILDDPVQRPERGWQALAVDVDAALIDRLYTRPEAGPALAPEPQAVAAAAAPSAGVPR